MQSFESIPTSSPLETDPDGGHTTNRHDDKLQQQQQEQEEADEEDFYENAKQPLSPLSSSSVAPPDNNNNSNNNTTTRRRTLSKKAKAIRQNFILLSLLFSANHGAVVSCLSTATARLGGELGSWQSSILYLSYTLTALLGATFVVKQFGGRNAMMAGMGIYCLYVACFALATAMVKGWGGWYDTVVFAGAVWGGVGGGLIWTAQGSYFVTASREYALANEQQQQQQQQQQHMESNANQEEQEANEEEDEDEEEEEENVSVSTAALTDASKIFGGIFAAIYLLEELILRLFSTVMIEVWNWSWHSIYIGYTIIAVSSTLLMTFVTDYPQTAQERRENETTSPFYKATATWRVLIQDCKMKYMIPLNAVFGFTAAFMTSFVSGEVLRIALNDARSIHVGIMTSVTSAVAAVCSLVFGVMAKKVGNGWILMLGVSSFFAVGLAFAITPSLEKWNVASLVVVYCLQGVGRATFEGTLRAEFAVIFADDKEGAFGNIPFQFGIISMIGFALTTGLNCPSSSSSPYCIEYENGTHHNMLAFEIIIMSTAVLAVLGYWRGNVLYKRELEAAGYESKMLVENDHLV